MVAWRMTISHRNKVKLLVASIELIVESAVIIGLLYWLMLQRG